LGIDQEDFDELQKMYQAEQEKSKSLQEKCGNFMKELSDSKIKYRKFLVGRFRCINIL